MRDLREGKGSAKRSKKGGGGILSSPIFMAGPQGHFFNSTSTADSPYNLDNYKFLSRIGKKAQKTGAIGWNYSRVEIKFADNDDRMKTLGVLRTFQEKNVDRSRSGYNH